MIGTFNKADIARDLIRRKRARESLHSYVLNIDIPTAPSGAMYPDEDLLGPAHLLMPIHHSKILEVAMRTILRPYGRALIMAPPGTAKSSYISVAVPPWAMCRTPGTRIILTSYASTLAQRQARRARMIADSKNNRDIWELPPQILKDADPEWTMQLGDKISEMLSAGITAGITGNRANGAIIDDPVAGREEADSPAMRKKILDAYQDDLLTRLLPGAWLILIMTRWNENDLAGEILPHDYKGESGFIRCRDGLDWEVLNMPAKAEHRDDPLGRKIGEYIWPEYYHTQHWQMFENGVGPERQRTWTSLYQQRPSPQGSGKFTRDMVRYYDDLPESAVRSPRVCCSDWAVSEGKNDFTEIGIGALDHSDNLYIIDWWYKQADTGESMTKFIEMIARHNCQLAFNEGGVIDKAVRPTFLTSLRDYNTKARQSNTRSIFCDLRSLPSMQDKLAKTSAIGARMSLGQVFFPRRAPWTEHIVDQLLALPAGRYDDAADVMGLFGRGLDQFHPPAAPRMERKVGIKPFTAEWIEYKEDTTPRVRYR